MFRTNMIKNNKITESKGFTLIEVLVAMAIFSIGILAIGSMQLAATKGSSSARLSTEAVTIAQSRAETLILMPYGPVASGSDLSFMPVYRVDWTVWVDPATTPWGVTPAANTKVIQVVATSQRGNPANRRSATITFVKGQDL